jgi:glycosyltransferase involved in cell wall biosynthesis
VTKARAKNALVASLNPHPGHYSHIVACYRLLGEAGYVPHLYVDRSLNQMDVDGEFRKVNDASELRRLGTVDVALFWSPSLRNVSEILRLRLRHGTKVLYAYHEPFDSIANYYKAGFRWLKIARIILGTLVNVPVLLLSHGVLLPSSAALSAYRRRFAWLNSNYRRIPLLFDDESRTSTSARREFVSYIGTVAADHAFDRFVDFVDAAVANGWLPDQRFLVATKSVIPDRERAILGRHLPSGRVVIAEGRPMSTLEINGHFERSSVVWNAYHRSMQSGILPKAFMFGAAVLVLRRNANEYVDDHVTGLYIEDNGNPAEIRDAVDEILKNQDAYTRECRKKFLDTFHYRGKIDDVRQLLDN